MILVLRKLVEGEIKTAKIRLDARVLRDETWEVVLPSNKPTTLELKDGAITVRPYYRKVQNGELTIFAEEVL